MIMNIEYKKLELEDIDLIIEAFANADWHKPSSLFVKYYEEQESQKRDIWVSYDDNVVLGYVTLKWSSDYYCFRQNNIPEIKDLNVLPQYRKQGIGSRLISLAEQKVLEQKNNIIGLGVGLTKEYGAAQQLYIKMGYIPDGNGLTYNGEPTPHGKNVLVDDDLNLWLTKNLNKK